MRLKTSVHASAQLAGELDINSASGLSTTCGLPDHLRWDSRHLRWGSRSLFARMRFAA